MWPGACGDLLMPAESARTATPYEGSDAMGVASGLVPDGVGGRRPPCSTHSASPQRAGGAVSAAAGARLRDAAHRKLNFSLSRTQRSGGNRATAHSLAAAGRPREPRRHPELACPQSVCENWRSGRPPLAVAAGLSPLGGEEGGTGWAQRFSHTLLACRMGRKAAAGRRCCCAWSLSNNCRRRLS